MLKIKFWRIENVILMKVLEQGDEIKRDGGVFFTDKDTGICISSIIFPACNNGEIFVRGRVRKDDNWIAIHRCKDTESAKELLSSYVLTVKCYNESLTNKEVNNLSDDDIECVIAE